MLGTVTKNKRELPLEFVVSNRPEHSSLFGHNDGVQMVSNMARPKKCVIMVSTMHCDNGVDLEDKEKPHAIRDYNATKCPVDRINQMANTFSTRRKIRRWSMTIFFNILDIAGINAYITWLLHNPTWHENEKVHRRSIFLKKLACSLMEPWIRQRPNNQPRGAMQATVRRARELCLNNAESPEVEAPQETQKARRRCHLYVGRSRVRTACSRCHQPTCMAHGSVICKACARNWQINFYTSFDTSGILLFFLLPIDLEYLKLPTLNCRIMAYDYSSLAKIT